MIVQELTAKILEKFLEEIKTEKNMSKIQNESNEFKNVE